MNRELVMHMASAEQNTRTVAATALKLIDSGQLQRARVYLANVIDPGREGAGFVADWRSAVLTCAVGFPIGGQASRIDFAVFATPRDTPALGETAETNRLEWAFKHETEGLRSTRQCIRQLAALPEHLRLAMTPNAQDIVDGTTGAANEKHWISSLLAAHAARRVTDERATRRLYYWAREAGMSQREVAESIRRPQTHVFRILKAIENEPSMLALSPREIHENYLAANIDRQTLLTLLAAYPYKSGHHPVSEPDWAYVPGSWDELSQLAIEGELTSEEFDTILAGVEALAGQDG